MSEIQLRSEEGNKQLLLNICQSLRAHDIEVARQRCSLETVVAFLSINSQFSLQHAQAMHDLQIANEAAAPQSLQTIDGLIRRILGN